MQNYLSARIFFFKVATLNSIVEETDETVATVLVVRTAKGSYYVPQSMFEITDLSEQEKTALLNITEEQTQDIGGTIQYSGGCVDGAEQAIVSFPGRCGPEWYVPCVDLRSCWFVEEPDDRRHQRRFLWRRS